MTARKHSLPVVLIADDDEFLRLLTADIVELAGFEVVQAKNADEALAVLEARADVALLLTDVDMPGSMDGVKLAHVVCDRWPPIKIVVVSSRIPQCALPEGSHFFQKPYLADTLVSKIRSLLGQELEPRPQQPPAERVA